MSLRGLPIATAIMPLDLLYHVQNKQNPTHGIRQLPSGVYFVLYMSDKSELSRELSCILCVLAGYRETDPLVNAEAVLDDLGLE